MPSTHHVVVDGSNLATEGRSVPSLAQLDEAVRTYLAEDPGAQVVVVVDASFGHRIDPSERAQLEAAELHGELVAPPAGAIGRGDAFVLRIAERTGATVLSNDSFQEFHDEHPWLFDEGRLVGGKPVPGVGWIFTPRRPVRGPRSRKAKARDEAEEGGLTAARKAAEVAKALKKAAKAPAPAKAVAKAPAVKRARKKGAEAPSSAASVSKEVAKGRAKKAAKANGTAARANAEAATTKASKAEAAKKGEAKKGEAKKGEAKKGEAKKATAKKSQAEAVGAKTVAKAHGGATKKTAAKKTAATATVAAARPVTAAKPAKGAKAAKQVKAAKRSPATASTRQVGLKAAIDRATEEVLHPEHAVSTDRVARSKPKRRRRSEPPPAVNAPLAFINFVAAYPLGSIVEGVVASFTSHGAMVEVSLGEGDVLHCYVPLTGLGVPPPRAARDVLHRGEQRAFALVALDPPRRMAELALPELAPALAETGTRDPRAG